MEHLVELLHLSRRALERVLPGCSCRLLGHLAVVGVAGAALGALCDGECGLTGVNVECATAKGAVPRLGAARRRAARRGAGQGAARSLPAQLTPLVSLPRMSL